MSTTNNQSPIIKLDEIPDIGSLIKPALEYYSHRTRSKPRTLHEYQQAFYMHQNDNMYHPLVLFQIFLMSDRTGQVQNVMNQIMSANAYEMSNRIDFVTGEPIVVGQYEKDVTDVKPEEEDVKPEEEDVKPEEEDVKPEEEKKTVMITTIPIPIKTDKVDDKVDEPAEEDTDAEHADDESEHVDDKSVGTIGDDEDDVSEVAPTPAPSPRSVATKPDEPVVTDKSDEKLKAKTDEKVDKSADESNKDEQPFIEVKRKQKRVAAVWNAKSFLPGLKDVQFKQRPRVAARSPQNKIYVQSPKPRQSPKNGRTFRPRNYRTTTSMNELVTRNGFKPFQDPTTDFFCNETPMVMNDDGLWVPQVKKWLLVNLWANSYQIAHKYGIFPFVFQFVPDPDGGKNGEWTFWRVIADPADPIDKRARLIPTENNTQRISTEDFIKWYKDYRK